MIDQQQISMATTAQRLVSALDSFGDDKLLGRGRILVQRAATAESWVCVAGETSSGKTSLVNSLVRHELLPVGAGPTTATLTHMVCRDGGDDEFYAINFDGTREPIGREPFAALALEPDENLMKLQVRTSRAGDEFNGLNLFDTPGYNSMVLDHDDIVGGFLRESDMVVYVVDYRVGFTQADHSLLDLVRLALTSSTEESGELPVLLVVNRVPESVNDSDRRIREISQYSEDQLRCDVKCLLVKSCAGADYRTSLLEPSGASEVWNHVAGAISSEDRLSRIRENLQVLLLELADELSTRISLEELTLGATEEELGSLRDVVGRLKQAENESIRAVGKTISHLESIVPKTIRLERDRMVKTVGTVVDRADKWFDKDECLAFLQHHALPFEERRAAREIGFLIKATLEDLDRQLDEIANTVVPRTRGSVEVESTAVHEFTASLGIVVARRLTSSAASSFLKGLGGVGGAAAGAGNLAKMALSKGGHLFGKEFSRPVYDQIGRVFSKRMLGKINALVTIAVEGSLFVWEAKTWQEKMKKQMAGILDTWQQDVDETMAVSDLPQIEEANTSSIHEIFSDQVDEYEGLLASRESPEKDDRLDLVRGLRKSIDSIRADLTEERTDD